MPSANLAESGSPFRAEDFSESGVEADSSRPRGVPMVMDNDPPPDFGVDEVMGVVSGMVPLDGGEEGVSTGGVSDFQASTTMRSSTGEAGVSPLPSSASTGQWSIQ